MAYNLRQDWEQTKRNLAQVAYDMRYSAAGQEWNDDMTDLVNEYKREEMAWYNSPQITENGFQTTTQNLWYSHYLNKRRLKALGLTARYDHLRPTEYKRGENKRYPHWHYGHDGRNLICTVSDSFYYRKNFYDGNRLVWSDEGRGSAGEYYIIQSRSLNGNYICPNCGWEDRLEYFVDGCDYCQTKFQIEDLKQKVSSVYNPGNWTQHRDGFTIHKNFKWMYAILLIIAFPLIMSVGRMGSSMMMRMPLIGFILVIVFVAALIGKTSKESIAGGPAKTHQTIEKLRGVDEHFSEETFIGNLSNKLMSICYADSAKEISPFATCDMTRFLAANRGVIDCKLLECVLMDYRVAGELQHLQVKAVIGVVSYENGNARERKIPIGLSLVKSVNAVKKSISDVNVYRCHSCGASLSLLNGGKCEYCGNCLDLKEYDWVIERYETAV